MPLLPSYTNQSTDLLVVRQKVKAFIRHFDAPKANQLTGFYLRATFAFNELTEKSFEGNENLCLKKSVIFPRNVTTYNSVRGGSTAAGTSKVECFVKIVNGVQSLSIITKHSTFDVAAALDPPLSVYHKTILLKTHAIYELDHSFRQKQKACEIQRTARLLPLRKSELRVIFSIFVITEIIFAALEQLKCLIRRSYTDYLGNF